MLELKNVTKRYGDKIAVSDVTLNLNDGEIFGFIGHNGAGKTTTIKSICGIIDFEGEVYLDGISVKSSPIEFKKLIAYIPDNPDLYESLSGRSYLNFICDIYEIRNVRDELIEKYASYLELSNDLDKLISSYSHGMKQKLQIIGAVIRKPRLLILDEPFVGLDPYATFKVKELMKELVKEKTIIFFSTHVLEVAQKLCDKVAIIKESKIVLVKDVNDITKDKSLEEVFMELK